MIVQLAPIIFTFYHGYNPYYKSLYNHPFPVVVIVITDEEHRLC
jgi:hypothetical protein